MTIFNYNEVWEGVFCHFEESRKKSLQSYDHYFLKISLTTETMTNQEAKYVYTSAPRIQEAYKVHS
jgi:hypothetical protein